MSDKNPRAASSEAGLSPAGIASAIAVVAVLIGLALFLANRPMPTGLSAAPTPAIPASESPITNTDAYSTTPGVNQTPVQPQNPTTGASPAASLALNVEPGADAPTTMIISPTKAYTATITTPRGNIIIRLRPDLAPITVNSFVFLARKGFYNGLTWHRVLPGFMAQGGDPTGTGSGGPGYSIPGEFTSKVLFDRPGLLAMARANDPDSAGSQFFITTAPADFLNQKYAIFGEVVQGQDIVDGIPLRDPDNAQDLQRKGETIVSITVTE